MKKDMKYVKALLFAAMLISCGNGATDQDAKTDTTSMPAERPIQDSQLNRSYGTQDLNTDSARRDSVRQ